MFRAVTIGAGLLLLVTIGTVAGANAAPIIQDDLPDFYQHQKSDQQLGRPWANSPSTYTLDPPPDPLQPTSGLWDLMAVPVGSSGVYCIGMETPGRAFLAAQPSL